MEVADTPSFSRRRTAMYTAEGSQLVDTLSDQWGTTEGGDDGKTVWFVRNLASAGSGWQAPGGSRFATSNKSGFEGPARRRLRPRSATLLDVDAAV